MRFTTNDGKFGILVDPVDRSGMFRFQLIVEGHLIGDTDPCFLGTAMQQIHSIPVLDDARLGLIFTEPSITLAALLSDENLHDASTMPLAESMDQWLIHGYIYNSSAIIIAREYNEGHLVDSSLISTLDSEEYEQIADAARSYWASVNSSMRS